MPSFPAPTVSIREVLYQFMNKEDQTVYSVFLHDRSSLVRASHTDTDFPDVIRCLDLVGFWAWDH